MTQHFIESTMLPQLPQHLQLPQHIQLANKNNGNSNNPHLIDQLHFMQEQETTHYQITENYLAISPWSTIVTSTDRRTMCSWSYDIVDACSIDREIACIGMSYFDRFMCTATSSSCSTSSSSSSSSRAKNALTSRREFQLAFIACLILALKCRAGMQVDSDFVSETICQKMYCEEEITKMEGDILKALGWRLNGPSPHEFIGGLIELLPVHCRVGSCSSLPSSLPSSSSSSSKAGTTGGQEGGFIAQLKSSAHIQVEQAMLDYSTAIRSSPSSIAHAALMTAMESASSSSGASSSSSTNFHPLDRMAWFRNIAMVTGMTTCGESASDVSLYGMGDRDDDPPLLFDVLGGSRFATDDERDLMCRSGGNNSNGTPVMTQGCYDLFGYNMPPRMGMGMTYCSPVSSSESSIASLQTETNEQLYLDVLSMASGSSGNSDFSPVCTMSDDDGPALEIP